MDKSLGECLSYEYGIVTMRIALPSKEPTCNWCPLLLEERTRCRCRYNNEPIFDLRSRPDFCPIEWEEGRK